MSSTGRSPTGISGLGSTVVYGRSRVPCPTRQDDRPLRHGRHHYRSCTPRVAVIIPCFNAGRLVLEAVASLEGCRAAGDRRGRRRLHGRRDRARRSIELEAERGPRPAPGGQRRRRGARGRPACGRRRAPFVLPLDADDLAIPGRITRAADLLDADPDAAACVGDYEEFGNDTIVRAVPGPARPVPARVHQRVRDHGADAPQRARARTAAGAIRSRRAAATRTGTCGWTSRRTAAGSCTWTTCCTAAGCTRPASTSSSAPATPSSTARCATPTRSSSPSCASTAAAPTLSTPRKLLYPLLYGERRLRQPRAVRQAATRPGRDLDASRR